eukprot:GHUV01022823.1.p1 GENE.GHUV01022823.1~~GHUV01022823.1.p1  ORF type:complete len:105 (+),score=16.33 GHUV01022823.1:372-686(+)
MFTLAPMKDSDGTIRFLVGVQVRLLPGISRLGSSDGVGFVKTAVAGTQRAQMPPDVCQRQLMRSSCVHVVLGAYCSSRTCPRVVFQTKQNVIFHASACNLFRLT